MKSSTHSIQSKQLADSWSSFLSAWDWDYFVTFTYRNPCIVGEKIERDLSGFLYQWAALEAEKRGLAKRRKPRNKTAYGGASGSRGGDAPCPPSWTGPFARVATKSDRNRATGVLAIEAHQSGALHAHGLVKSPAWFPLSIKTGHSAWFDRHGWIQIEQPSSQEAINRYCSKYTVKGGEIVLGPYLSRTPHC